MMSACLVRSLTSRNEAELFGGDNDRIGAIGRRCCDFVVTGVVLKTNKATNPTPNFANNSG